MSVIAYDGKIIAADRQVTQYDMVRIGTKLVRSGGHVFGWVGDVTLCFMMRKWFEGGQDEDEWPEAVIDESESCSILIVASASGIVTYRQHPVAVPLEEDRWVWGSGAELAMGAMEAGLDARGAVEAASRHNIYCGGGVDWFDLTALPKSRRKAK